MRIVATVASVSRLSRLRRTSENSVNRKFNFAEFYKGEVRRIPIPRTSVNRSYAGALLVLLLQRCRAGSSGSLHAGIGQVLMDQRHRHSTLSHRGGAPLDRATTRVASCEYARL